MKAISTLLLHTLFLLLWTVTAIGYQMPQGNSLCGSIKKDRSVLVIINMAARNDLLPFAGKHVKQLQQLQTNDKVKIFVRLDIQKPDNPPVTKLFFVEKNKILQIGEDLKLDGGSEEDLILTVKTAYDHFPADEVCLIFWNHGTGPLEPTMHRTLSPSELYTASSKTGKLELNKSLRYIDALSYGESACQEPKGICFDESTGNYLTVHKLTKAIKTISQEIIKRKINILACDACLMAGVDVFTDFQPFVRYFIGSQEVELGTGYNYQLLIEPLLKGNLACDAYFARHFVAAYEKTYGDIMDYYTHCALDLTYCHYLEAIVDDFAQLLLQGLERQKNKSVKEMLRLSRHKNNCTRFNEPTFLDFGHLLSNVGKNISKVELTTATETADFKKQMLETVKKGLEIIDHVVIANAVGKKHQNATGISLYFPEFVIHKSYHNNAFAKRTHWLKFLKRYLDSK